MPQDRPERRYVYHVTPAHDQVVNAPLNRSNSNNGFVHAEQKAALASRWTRLTDRGRARPDGTLAAQGYGRWHLREAQRLLGLSEEELCRHVRDSELIAYRARIGDHWEWH